MKTQKICIVTSHNCMNYGSGLQATALYKYIESKGFDVILLNQWRVYQQMLYHPSLLYNRICVILNRRNERKFFSSSYQISEERKNKIKQYEEHILEIKSVSYFTNRQWNETVKEKTCFVAGGDIIWNPARGYPSKFFLDFAYCSHLKMFSYASSVGEKFLPKKYYRAYRKYLSAFDHIGVRERSAACMIEKIIHKPVETVLDPTLLMDSIFWDFYADKAEISISIDNKGYVLCYFVMNDPRYWDYVRSIKEETGLQIIVLPMHNSHENQPYSIIYDGAPCEFVWLIKNAAFICTDSFHACAFALNYKKEFYLLRRARKSEDDKFDDFLSRYGLTDRNVKDESRFIRKTYIDYEEAHKRLQEDRQKSFKYLDTALFDCKNKG